MNKVPLLLMLRRPDESVCSSLLRVILCFTVKVFNNFWRTSGLRLCCLVEPEPDSNPVFSIRARSSYPARFHHHHRLLRTRTVQNNVKSY